MLVQFVAGSLPVALGDFSTRPLIFPSSQNPTYQILNFQPRKKELCTTTPPTPWVV